jgi:Chaperone of endosialidase
MANTVNILSYNNTFGDLVAQQNLAANELNTLGASNYTKNTGTLYLAGSGTGLSVTNTAILGTAVISTTTSAFGDVTAAANVFVTGLNYALQVSNSAIIAKTTLTDSLVANTNIRTNFALANTITSNNIIRAGSLNSNGRVDADALYANTVVYAPYINGTTSGVFNALISNTSITGTSISVTSGTVSGTLGTVGLTVSGTATMNAVAISSGTFTSGTFSGQASLTGLSTSVTGDANTSNTQIATTAWVKNVLNSGNTFSIYALSANPYLVTMNQGVNTANNVQFASLGIGTAPTGTAGEIRATNNITAYYSDDRLKTRLGNIENALSKVMSLNGFHYEANETAQALGYAVKREVGLSAQETQKVLPEVVVPAPIDEKYLTIHYERVIPLLVEAIKELKQEIDSLKK